jgi:hypothetical protein
MPVISKLYTMAISFNLANISTYHNFLNSIVRIRNSVYCSLSFLKLIHFHFLNQLLIFIKFCKFTELKKSMSEI